MYNQIEFSAVSSIVGISSNSFDLEEDQKAVIGFYHVDEDRNRLSFFSFNLSLYFVALNQFLTDFVAFHW